MLSKFTGPGIFRFFLALAVFATHTSRLEFGGAAVHIFFCLSGYWIYTMYIERYAKTRRPYLTFVVSRMWRLLPVFWLINLLVLLFLYLNGSSASEWYRANPAHFVLSNLLILGYDNQPIGPLGQAWSLDIEVQFYLIAPFIAIFLARRKVPGALVLLAVGALSLTAFVRNCPIRVAAYLIYFMIGMTAASVHWQPSRRVALTSLVGTVLLIACWVATPWRGVIIVGVHPGPLAIYSAHANEVIGLLMAPFAIYTTGQKGFVADGMFADLSYIVYLLQTIGVLWVVSHPGGVLTEVAYKTAAWILVTGFSVVIWKFFDRPINRLRSLWVNSRKYAAVLHAETPGSESGGAAVSDSTACPSSFDVQADRP